MRAVTLCVFTTLLLSSHAQGQTTRPASDPWAGTVERFAQALTQNDPTALVPVLADDISVHSFDSRAADAVRLLSRTQGATLIGAKAYVHAPSQLATDIADAFAAAQAPEELKRYMRPANDAQTARANAAGARWLGESLGAKQGDLVGVVVFWSAPPGDLGLNPGVRPEITFVLVKGTMAGAGPKIESIVFGDPRQRPPSS